MRRESHHLTLRRVRPIPATATDWARIKMRAACLGIAAALREAERRKERASC